MSHGLMNEVVDSSGMHSTSATETAYNGSQGPRPFSSHSDNIIFSPHQDTFPSIQSHSTPDLHHGYLPKRIISRLSDNVYANKNDRSNV
ncbi:hypothetical protein JR316_0003041 [Psilocybe cubensis]|uniref:Uncharacterized protein n=1 Tax=Psilocybe cubensis TaxID=181762 RepID=A0ACB8H6S8_PSICU|nr:hypothetical protein JR316_0003041 [Psilocybe cubensis]KAH9483571.1 hypothetical protein JR316_0003041 [Psilocybe cubensis]